MAFDVSVGSDATGQTVLAYARCGHETRTRVDVRFFVPQYRDGAGCRIFRYGLVDGVEQEIAYPKARGRSAHYPVLDQGVLTYARVRRLNRRLRRFELIQVDRDGHQHRVPGGTNTQFIQGQAFEPDELEGPLGLASEGGRLAFLRGSAGQGCGLPRKGSDLFGSEIRELVDGQALVRDSTCFSRVSNRLLPPFFRDGQLGWGRAGRGTFEVVEESSKSARRTASFADSPGPFIQIAPTPDGAAYLASRFTIADLSPVLLPVGTG